MDRGWREIASYACDLLGGLICLPGLICVISVIEYPDIVFKLVRDLFPEASWPSIFVGLALLPIGGAVCFFLGAWVRSVADRTAPEPKKSFLGL